MQKYGDHAKYDAIVNCWRRKTTTFCQPKEINHIIVKYAHSGCSLLFVDNKYDNDSVIITDKKKWNEFMLKENINNDTDIDFSKEFIAVLSIQVFKSLPQANIQLLNDINTADDTITFTINIDRGSSEVVYFSQFEDHAWFIVVKKGCKINRIGIRKKERTPSEISDRTEYMKVPKGLP